MSWMTAEEEARRARAELMRDVVDFPLVIAALDSPRWEPAQMWFHEDPWSAGTRYVPVGPSPEPDGFGPTLRSHPLEGTHDPAWTPLHEGYGLEGGSRLCGAHGDVVIVDSADDAVGATPSTDPPTVETGAPTTEFPDIGTVELSGHVRAARPGGRGDRLGGHGMTFREHPKRGVPFPLPAPYRAARVTATGHPHTGVWGTVRNGGRMVQETRTSVTKCCCRAFLG